MMIKRLFYLLFWLLLLFFPFRTNLLIAQYSIDSCKKLAIENNHQLHNSSLQIQAAQQTKNAALTKYFPSISATGVAFTSNKPIIDIDAEDLLSNIHSTNAQMNDIWQTLYMNYGNYLSDFNFQMIDDGMMVGAVAIQPIFAGGQIVNGNRLAKLGIEAANYQLAVNKNEVLLKTEQSYWLVISLQEKLKTIQTVQAMLDTVYQFASSANAAGVMIKNDVLKVKLKQNEFQSNRLKVENGIQLAKMALCHQIGIPFDKNIALTDTLTEIVSPYNYQQDLTSSVNNRTESKLLQLSVNAEELKKKMIIGKALPQIGIGTTYSLNNILGDFNNNWMGFATVSIPVTSWWETAHNIKKQEINKQIAENTRAEYNSLMLLQMQQVWNELEEAFLQTTLAQESIAEAEENLKLINQFYHAGTATISDVLEAQALLQNSYDQHIDYYIQYKIKLRQYLQMTNQE